MAVTDQARPIQEMATETEAGSRKIMIGLNVTVMILLATAFVVIVNILALKTARIHKDFASFGSYGLSDRTKAVLSGVNGDGAVKVTTVYLSTEAAKSREKYLPKLQSYGDELKLAGGNKV